MSYGTKNIVGANDEFWRLPKVTEKVGVSKSTWWEWVRRGIAPKGIKLTNRITVWRASEIYMFIERSATNGLMREAG